MYWGTNLLYIVCIINNDNLIMLDQINRGERNWSCFPGNVVKASQNKKETLKLGRIEEVLISEEVQGSLSQKLNPCTRFWRYWYW